MALVFMRLLNSGGYPDPFAPYADLKPGSSIGTVETLHCSPKVFPEFESRGVCLIPTNGEVFTTIEIIEHLGTIERITFFANDLQTVDLVNHWGKPEAVRQHKRHAVMRWGDGVIAQTTAPVSRFTYQSPIEWVMLIRISTTVDLLFHDSLPMSSGSRRLQLFTRL
jgi:hypothetical protein